MEELAQQLIIGITNGMVFALIALGYTMVYGILELINFAHGDLFMLAGFLALTLVGALGLAPDSGTFHLLAGLLLIAAACALFAAGVNWTADRLVFRPLRGQAKLTVLVSAIGLSFVFQNLGLFWGAAPMAVFGYGRSAAAKKDFPSLIPNDNWFGEGATLRFSTGDFVVIVAALATMAALYLFVTHTRLGKAMRATAQNPTAARLMGIDTNAVIGATFAIGGALAGVAAVIYALQFNTVDYQMGYMNGLYAFTAAVMGGIGSIPGALLGGLTIGLLRAFCDHFLGAEWQPAVVFGTLIALLVFRPAGILGNAAREKV